MSFSTIAFRNIPRRKLRNALTVLAVVLGVSLIVGVNIAFDSVIDQFKDVIGDALGDVDINIRSSLDTPFDQDVLDEVRDIEGVSEAAARISGGVQVMVSGDWAGATLMGIHSSSDFEFLDLESTNITGVKDLRMNSTDAVVSEALNYSIGEIMGINVTMIFNYLPQTRSHNLSVVGIYYPNPTISGYLGDRIYIDLVKAQTIYNYTNTVDSIAVKVVNIKQTDQVVENLNSELGSLYIVNPVKQTLINTIDDAISGLSGGLQIMSILALFVAVVIVLNTIYMNVGERTYEIGILRSQGASTGQVFWMFFSESLLIGLIGAGLGLITGLLLTNVFSYITGSIFRSFGAPIFSVGITLNPTTIQHLMTGASAGIITAVIGGIFPSLSACRIDVIKALRPSMRKAGKPRTALKLVAVGLPLTIFGSFLYAGYTFFEQFGSGLTIVSILSPIPMIGSVLLIAGLLRSASPLVERLLLPFGNNRKLISRNVERNLMRSTICFALIGISLSFVIVISGAQDGVVLGVEDVIRSFSSSDITVTSTELISRSFADNLTDIEDGALIKTTAPALVVPGGGTMLFNIASSKNSSTSIMAIDPDTYSVAMSMTFSEDTPSNVFYQLERSGTIILTSPLAQVLDVAIDDVVKMRIVTYTYFGPITTYENFTVVGLAGGAWLQMMSFGSFPLTEACYISYNSLDDTFPLYSNNATMFFIKIEDGQDVDYIEDKIEDLYDEEYDLYVSTYNDAVKGVRSSIDEIFYILYTVVIFAVVNAAIGVIAISVMNVVERRREIGIFSSQGMNKLQIISIILGEVTVLGVVGFFLSVLTGMIFHRITVSYMSVAGFPMPFHIPFGAFGISLLLSLFTTTISVIYPSYRATKINIVEALRR
ncbi:ABC transporter permease [Candidatus Bathyarchaeota archaeon]|nr:ABC transporter permease [Candidatus Bathyarchaeota archaeon]